MCAWLTQIYALWCIYAQLYKVYGLGKGCSVLPSVL